MEQWKMTALLRNDPYKLHLVRGQLQSVRRYPVADVCRLNTVFQLGGG